MPVAWPPPSPPFQLQTVVIDAGHGGHDPGCLGASSQEKHIALAIAQELAVQIKTHFPAINVVLTRNEDVFIPLHERAHIANRSKANLFISIHCNFMPGSAATQGTETFVMGLHTADHNLDVAKRENSAILLEDNYERNYDYDPNSPEGHILMSMFQSAYIEQSISFAEKVERHFAHTAQRRSRGVKQAGFVVLKETAMPSVLVETGFLSNKAEEEYLLTPAGQQQVAAALLEAFREYKQEAEGDLPTAATPTPPNRAAQPTPPPAAVATNPAPPPAAVPTAVATRPAPPPAAAAPVVTQPRAVPPPPAAAGPQDIRFTVQLSASTRPVSTAEARWQNLGYLVEMVQDGSFYKYLAGNFTDFNAAQQARASLQTRGFPDAFIVAYQQGVRITVEEARRLLGQ